MAKPKIIRLVRDPATGQHSVAGVQNSRDFAPGEPISVEEVDALIDDEGWVVHVRAGKEPKQ